MVIFTYNLLSFLFVNILNDQPQPFVAGVQNQCQNDENFGLLKKKTINERK
jgi:hypothetical protein